MCEPLRGKKKELEYTIERLKKLEEELKNLTVR